MAIDLTVVCSRRPDAEVVERLTSLALARVEQLTTQEIEAVSWFEPDEAFHEFVGEHVVMLGAVVREPSAYLRMLVMASAIAVLYDGRLHDEVGFFPAASPSDLLLRCVCGPPTTSDRLWSELGLD